MIKGIGIDILKIEYIDQMLEKHGENFLKLHYSPMEIQVFFKKKRYGNQYLAGRFAAKEAFLKAISFRNGFEPKFCDIEIINDCSGKPELKLLNNSFGRLKEDLVWLSISHHCQYAIAQVIIEQR